MTILTNEPVCVLLRTGYSPKEHEARVQRKLKDITGLSYDELADFLAAVLKCNEE